VRAVKTFLLKHPGLLLFLGKVYGLARGVRLHRRADGAWVVSRGSQEVWLAPAHAAYARDVIREFDYYFTSVTPEQRDGKSVVDCTAPRMQILDGLTEPILITGLPEPNATNLLYAQLLDLPSGGVVIDAGAYCGASGLLFAQQVGSTGKVIAVEADPANFKALLQNTASNPAITCVPAALWSSRGTLVFASEGNMGSAVQSDGGAVRPGAARVEVPALTLADLIDRFALTRVDGIKLDIEGAEYEVLPAIGDIVARFRPRIVFELHAASEGQKAALKDVLLGYGYRVEQVKQSENEGAPLMLAVPD